MNDRERALLGGILARLLRAVDDLDEEPTFRNISFADRDALFCDIAELRDGERPRLADADGPIAIDDDPLGVKGKAP